MHIVFRLLSGGRGGRCFFGRANCQSLENLPTCCEDYGQWLFRTSLRKLFVNAEPGSQLIGRSREFCRSWPNQEEVTIRGIHFVQEDSPQEIGLALARFIRQTRPASAIPR